MRTATNQIDYDLDALPANLDSPHAKLVYLTLSMTGGASLAELHDALAVPKLTLLSVLDALVGRELVERTESGFRPAA